mmetsp:Transcript_93710/g.166733  ORF Transcript_93710/g.166733 Transcript_93710/m.166733 type:complete len:483 (+) Transcript_93710:129-1577(+)|eukprot:CAMPEP_0197629248 /NCGR_PEP_ID=MMETSP1338-20131121/7184_1 /TAXON_ID=43686 ORGANISM="Pelagodinium beii, Strain RCC1491" /NCGR_SAMPLE_ID=MMETSP1338 /ASSEMBLY_ACC=CAM_ASM_000754 /LENGTH=482 /DNA_ID=CAMNT_0043200275 /DNA_START=129 /DNA_END=1577 /DNA_ORIENTATION=+
MPEQFPIFHAAWEKEPTAYLFTGAKIYDGHSDVLHEGKDLLVQGNLIIAVGQGLEDESAVIVDCAGRTLMPGLIDMHSHLCLQEGMLEGRDHYDQMAMGAMCAHDLMDYLQQGFTTCRDAGGNVLGIAKAVNADRIPGPRIFACGAFLSQTGGHGDTGCCVDQPGDTDELERNGFAHVVDGRPEVLKAARNNLRNGATQLKIMAGGGCASMFDPIHVTQFSLEEMKTAVEVAKDYGTYVMAHAYHDDSINRCLDAGVRCIEHGFLMSEATMKRIADEGAAISLQAVMSLEAFANPETLTFFTKDQREKAAKVASGSKHMMQLVRRYQPVTVSGGDMFGHAQQHRQAENIIALVTLGGFSTAEALRTATGDAAKVLSWSGGMSPYKEGSLGVIAPGAYADLILLEGNVMEDVTCLRREKVKLVLKNGRCYKCTPDLEIKPAKCPVVLAEPCLEVQGPLAVAGPACTCKYKSSLAVSTGACGGS